MTSTTSPETDARPPRRTVSPQRYRTIAVVAWVLQVAIVMTGGAVRLTGSGLGCTDWPVCERSEPIPAIGFHAWVEFGNRLFTFAVVVSVIAAIVGARRLATRRRDLEVLSWGLVAGVVAQIILGAFVVILHLEPVAVSAHFLVSMALVADAVVLVHRSDPARVVDRTDPAAPERDDVGAEPMVLASSLMVASVLIVLVLGTVVTGSGPHSGDEDQLGRLGFDIADVARIHAIAVWVSVALMITTIVLALRRGVTRACRRWAEALILTAVLQGAIGYTQYFNGVPATLVAAHLFGAALVWSSAVMVHLDVRANARRAVEPTAPADDVPAEATT